MNLLSALKSYAIALPERSDNILAEMQGEGLSVEIIPATDMRNESPPVNWIDKPNDYGCALSWLNLLEQASYKNDVFIAYEDDFVFRYDTLPFVPSWDSIQNVDFDCIYLTGHYSKGATRCVPRRFISDNNLVRSFGIHTLPARVIRSNFAKILIDRIHHSMKELGYGADRTDAILCTERGKTYALEAHIGGQRSGDRRSWEPRVIDSSIRYNSGIINAYQTPEENIAETTSLVALCSRHQSIAIVNGSVRHIACASEGLVDCSGSASAYNSEYHYEKYINRTDDRLNRYRFYGVLELFKFDKIDDLVEKPTCMLVEYGQNIPDETVNIIAHSIAKKMPKPSIIIAVGTNADRVREYLSTFKVYGKSRIYGISDRAVFLSYA